MDCFWWCGIGAVIVTSPFPLCTTTGTRRLTCPAPDDCQVPDGNLRDCQVPDNPLRDRQVRDRTETPTDRDRRAGHSTLSHCPVANRTVDHQALYSTLRDHQHGTVTVCQ